jgi:uncharacterized pyridoxal phosphate-containing UPF0001 family protein
MFSNYLTGDDQKARGDHFLSFLELTSGRYYYIFMMLKNTVALMKRLSRATMKSDRIPDDIEFVVDTAGISLERLKEAADICFRFFGAPNVAEAKERIGLFGQIAEKEAYQGVQWHFTGGLRGEDGGDAVRLFDLIETVDSLDLAREISLAASDIGKIQRILVRVAVTAAAPGVAADGLFELLVRVRQLPAVKVEGLSLQVPPETETAASRPLYEKLRRLRDEAEEKGFAVPHLSMGGNEDFEVAIEEGATFVTIREVLFEGC